MTREEKVALFYEYVRVKLTYDSYKQFADALGGYKYNPTNKFIEALLNDKCKDSYKYKCKMLGALDDVKKSKREFDLLRSLLHLLDTGNNKFPLTSYICYIEAKLPKYVANKWDKVKDKDNVDYGGYDKALFYALNDFEDLERWVRRQVIDFERNEKRAKKWLEDLEARAKGWRSMG